MVLPILPQSSPPEVHSQILAARILVSSLLVSIPVTWLKPGHLSGGPIDPPKKNPFRGVPIVAQQKRTQPVSMKMWVGSLASL